MVLAKDSKISAGSFEFNKFLEGGYENDIITTIYGPAGSGKTNMCMLVAASQAKKGNKIIYIDTEGGFSIDRFRQLINEDTVYEKVLENIILIKPLKFADQKRAFDNFAKSLKESKISLIIVDGMTMLYRLELGDAIQLGDNEQIRDVNRELARQLRILAEIARTKNIPIVVTNQVYSDFVKDEELKEKKEKKFNMVGGDLLKYWSKCLIEVKQIGGKVRMATLVKHRSLPEKKLEFTIVNEGIKKAGFF